MQFPAGGIERDLNFLGELSNGLACFQVSKILLGFPLSGLSRPRGVLIKQDLCKRTPWLNHKRDVNSRHGYDDLAQANLMLDV